MKFDAIILAAGRGKRMKPFSDLISKPMLPILNKPLISIIAEQLLNIGAEKLIIVVSQSNGDEIKTFFQKQSYSNKIVYCLQDPPQGTADAIYKAGLQSSADVLVSMAGDNVFSEKFCLSMISEFFKLRNSIQCIITLIEVTKEEITKLASVKMNDKGLITSIIEKPKLEDVESTLASLSVYIFEKSLLDFFGNVPLSPRGEYEAPDAFIAMLQNKNTINIKGLVTKEKYVHISNPFDLWKYNMDYLEGKTNHIAKNAKIPGDSILQNCIIGENVIVGKNCKLENCLVLERVKVPDNTILKGGILGNSTDGFEVYIITEKE